MMSPERPGHTAKPAWICSLYIVIKLRQSSGRSGLSFPRGFTAGGIVNVLRPKGLVWIARRRNRSSVMPHIIVKMFVGRSDEVKQQLAHALTKTLIDTLGSSEKSISVGIEDVAPH